MGKKRKYLSHEEIWDDSALVNSWDLALQEYQVSKPGCNAINPRLTFTSYTTAFMPAERRLKMSLERLRTLKKCQRIRGKITA